MTDHHANDPSAQPRTSGDRAAARRMLARLRSGRDVRAVKVWRMGQAVRSGNYVNALKWTIAAERLIDELL